MLVSENNFLTKQHYTNSQYSEKRRKVSFEEMKSWEDKVMRVQGKGARFAVKNTLIVLILSQILYLKESNRLVREAVRRNK